MERINQFFTNLPFNLFHKQLDCKRNTYGDKQSSS